MIARFRHFTWVTSSVAPYVNDFQPVAYASLRRPSLPLTIAEQVRSMNEYRVGGRYLHAKTRHPLTVRYIGTLPPLPAPPSAGPSGVTASASSSQFWLGVEYDDPSHGRGHSGTFEGIGVFCTGQDGAGAFVKLAPGVLSPGRTLASAVEERYGAIIPNNEPFVEKGGLSTEDSVQLGTSKIVVEAPGMEAVRKKIGRLEKLREVGLEGEWIGSLGGDPDTNKRMRERLKGQFPHHAIQIDG